MNANTDNDDSVLRSYLLGSLAPESRENVEKRLFSEDRIFWEHLCLVEDEIIDEYAQGTLSSEERNSFEQHFLCTDERRAKLEFARALKAHVEQREASRQRVWDWLRRPLVPPAWAAGMAALLLLALPVVTWRLAAGHGAQGDVSAWLSLGLVRDAGGELTRVRIPAACRLVRLQLEAGAAEHDSYRATLHEVTGEEIWSQNKLGPGPAEGRLAVTLTLPCQFLPEGDYYVTLSGSSPGEDPAPLGRYDFRVLRP